MEIFFVRPVKAAKDDKEDLLQLSGILAKALYSEDLKNAYLQLNIPDSDYRSIFRVLGFSWRFIVSFISIFYLILYYLLTVYRPEDTLMIILEIIAATVIALLIVGLYQPIRFVTNDSRVLVANYDGTFQIASIDILDYINNFLVITGMITGYNLIRRELLVRNIVADPITILILYAILTAVVLIMISPALFPAMLVYRNFHSKIVNSLRTNLAKNGVGTIKIDRRAVFSVLDEKETKYVLGEGSHE